MIVLETDQAERDVVVLDKTTGRFSQACPPNETALADARHCVTPHLNMSNPAFRTPGQNSRVQEKIF